MEVHSLGRPRLYCSSACKQRAYRVRAAPDVPADLPGALKQRATALADALTEEVASCRRLLLADSEPGEPADGASAHELARTALTYAWQLLQTTKVLELNAPLAGRLPAAE
jgi:hypothetical protein